MLVNSSVTAFALLACSRCFTILRSSGNLGLWCFINLVVQVENFALCFHFVLALVLSLAALLWLTVWVNEYKKKALFCVCEAVMTWFCHFFFKYSSPQFSWKKPLLRIHLYQKNTLPRIPICSYRDIASFSSPTLFIHPFSRSRTLSSQNASKLLT